MTKLARLRINQKFLYKGEIREVIRHEGGMTEVKSHQKYWCWPSSSKVNVL
jgi:hypothetical protein